jgi:hypothetical protein
MRERDASKYLERGTFRPGNGSYRSEFIRKLEKKEKKDSDWRKKFRKIVARTAIVASGLGLMGSADAYNNYEVESSAVANVNFRSDPLYPETDGTAIVFFDGFGTFNANTLTKYIGPLIQENVMDGELWSVSYGNAPLDSQDLTDKILATAADRNIDTIVVAGYSTGGIIGTESTDILMQTPGVQVPAVVNISTPNGYEGLRPARQAEIGAAHLVADLPYAEYSTLVRFIGEMYFRNDQYSNGANAFENGINFAQTGVDVINELDNPELPGTWLLIDQVLAIETADLQQNLHNIGQAPSNKLRPVVIYLGTDEPGYDYMVDNARSSADICSYAAEAQLQCQIYDVPGAIHTRPDLANDEYRQTLQLAAPAIRRAFDDEQSNFNIHNAFIPTRLTTLR